MARYTGPTSRISRRFGEPIFGPDKALAKKAYAPGQHGNSRRRGKKSEYGVQLDEKQKAKYTYGILEKQFSNLFKEALRRKGITGEILLQMCELRLDNVVYRLGVIHASQDYMENVFSRKNKRKLKSGITEGNVEFRDVSFRYNNNNSLFRNDVIPTPNSLLNELHY